MLAVYRIGVAVPTPGIDGQALASFFDAASGTLFGWVNLFSGGALERFSVLALGIMPYISVAIVLDLLKIASPYLDELYKEGEAGRRKITQYTRYGTVLLALFQGTMIAFSLEKIQAPGGGSIVYNPGPGFIVMTVLTVTAERSAPSLGSSRDRTSFDSGDPASGIFAPPSGPPEPFRHALRLREICAAADSRSARTCAIGSRSGCSGSRAASTPGVTGSCSTWGSLPGSFDPGRC